MASSSGRRFRSYLAAAQNAVTYSGGPVIDWTNRTLSLDSARPGGGAQGLRAVDLFGQVNDFARMQRDYQRISENMGIRSQVEGQLEPGQEVIVSVTRDASGNIVGVSIDDVDSTTPDLLSKGSTVERIRASSPQITSACAIGNAPKTTSFEVNVNGKTYRDKIAHKTSSSPERMKPRGTSEARTSSDMFGRDRGGQPHSGLDKDIRDSQIRGGTGMDSDSTMEA